MIGTLGDVVFQVSTEKVFTFQSLQRTGRARYQKHNVISTKPVLEFVGDDLDEIPLTITLNQNLGIKVVSEITRLRDYKSNGERLALIIGGRVFGYFVIEEVQDSWDRVSNRGECMLATVNLNLTESVDS
jgi:phage protein U